MNTKTRSILIGGVVAGVAGQLLSQVPFLGACFCCLAYTSAGALAVWYYTREDQLTIAGGEGATMGALAGVVAALAATVLSLLLITAGVLPSPAEAFEMGLEQAVEQGQIGDEQAEGVREMFGSATFYFMIVIVSVVVAAILSAIGGAIGAAVFKKGGDQPASEW